MPTVNRPPFWVPRPSDDSTWNAAPVHSPIIPFLTQQKIYGAGGQVPTKRWQPYYNYDVGESFWNIPPQGSWPLRFLTQQKLFGQGGQVPPFRPNFTYDDSSGWQWPAPASWPLRTLQKIYGAGGQVPPFRPNFTYDDSSFWPGAPTAAAPISLLTQQKMYGQGGQVPPFRWNHTLDDPPVWSGSPLRSFAIQLLTPQRIYGQGGQVPPFRPNFTLDDSSFWQGNPISSAAIQLLTPQKFYGQGGQVPPSRWNFNLDDAAIWQPLLARNSNLYSVATQNPFSNRQNWFIPDDSSTWQFVYGQNFNLFVSVQSTPAIIDIYVNMPADDPFWQGSPIGRNSNVLAPVAPQDPFYNRIKYWYSEDSVWQGAPIRSAAIPMLTVGGIIKAKFWRWDYDVAESQWWYTNQRAVLVLTTAIVFPKNIYHWNFDYNDQSFHPASSRRFNMQLNPPAVNQRRLRTLMGVGQ